MSQKKVNQYKERKANRSKEQKKELFYDWLEKVVGVLVCVAWIGYSVYEKVEQKQDAVVTETTMDTSALDEYMTNVNTASETAE